MMSTVTTIITTHRGGAHQLGDDVDGHGEDDGAVVLRRDAVQGLQVSQLRGKC